jgi:hypothetical protein
MRHRFRPYSDQIETLDDLRRHLQIALELEHATIPPYLCALYSIKDGSNREAARVLKSIVMEEMLHLALAANVLNALGGKPSLNHAGFVPAYPAELPHSDGAFRVGLEKFSQGAVETFLKLEHPAEQGAKPKAEHYHTIGQFYAAIEDGLKRLCKGDRHFEGDPKRQVTGELFYGGGGRIRPVKDLHSALDALEEIVHQGEGLPYSISDGDDKLFGQPRQVAHYFRLQEIHHGRLYATDDTPRRGLSGPEFPVVWDAVYDMRPNPKATDYPPASELRHKCDEFNAAYAKLLLVLHRSFNGEPGLLRKSAGLMYDLKYRAIALMNMPSGFGTTTAGPTFEPGWVTWRSR